MTTDATVKKLNAIKGNTIVPDRITITKRMEDYIKKHNETIARVCNELSNRLTEKYIKQHNKNMDTLCRELVSICWNHIAGCKAPLRIKNGEFQIRLMKNKQQKQDYLKHRKYMKTILNEILNVCWCHGCGYRKYLGNNYVSSLCSKGCWRANIRDAEHFCVLGEMCMNCIKPKRYTLAKAYHIQVYYNLDPMGAKDKKYTKSAKPCIVIEFAEDYTDDCNYKDLVGQY